ncbi:DUF6492 family protein [Aurantiacibacter sediminis]|uniref:Glycosyl transferase n=1 Tax=Aurantiacibacter sediminis TaxID=2793064 RepID=A0ABS0MZX2_9SPHN|nr:DUF6492 family protein [Aurantiacibacter sediminis]MBH5321253.1 hypothetical protein [Aurantiacibacter sediminis]
MQRRMCVVTVTYRGDISLFEQLCQSMDAVMPEMEHHVLLDPSDLTLFQRFEGPHRRIVDASTLLPQFREFTLGSRRLWWRWPFFIARGWTYQQLVKIAYVSQLDYDAALLADSDMIFLRALQDSDVFDPERVRLYHRPGQADGPEFVKWHNSASRCLGLPETGYTGSDYISTAVIWSPEVVRAMVTRIETSTGRKWHDALIANFRFSEYITYGIFCQRVPGAHRDLVSPTKSELCHCSWHYDLRSEAGVEAFVAELQPHHAGVLIQSNLGMNEAERNDILARFRAS